MGNRLVIYASAPEEQQVCLSCTPGMENTSTILGASLFLNVGANYQAPGTLLCIERTLNGIVKVFNRASV